MALDASKRIECLYLERKTTTVLENQMVKFIYHSKSLTKFTLVQKKVPNCVEDEKQSCLSIDDKIMDFKSSLIFQ